MIKRSHSFATAFALAALAGSLALASAQSGGTPPTPPATKKTTPPAQKPTAPSAAEQMPDAGMTPEQMEAMMAASIPGPMHKHLAKSVGTWNGQVTMFMPGSPEPMKSECVTVITPMMDGRFTKSETTGEMAGMGSFTGFGIYGFDNVSKKFQSAWADNMGTGMMTGTGELSADGKTINWSFDYNCPITQKPTVMREVERWIDDNTMSLAMWGPDPTTGKEMKMMEIAYSRATPTGTKAPTAPAGTRAPSGTKVPGGSAPTAPGRN